MNIGIRLHDTAPGTLTERLGFAKMQGFSCAHLALSKTIDGFAMIDAPRLLNEEMAAQVREAFEVNGLDCAVLGCYLSLADKDEEARRHTQEIYRAHLRFARMIGAQVVGTETPPAKGTSFAEPFWDSEEALRLFINSVRPVVRWAEEEGQILAIEPVFRHVMSTVERTERVLEAIPSDNLRIILDAVNLISPAMVDNVDEVVEKAIRRLGDKVSVLHMKDFDRTQLPDEVHSIACGTGEMRYERLVTFGRERNLPMTLEDTKPHNAEAARLHLEQVAAQIK